MARRDNMYEKQQYTRCIESMENQSNAFPQHINEEPYLIRHLDTVTIIMRFL